MEQQNNVPRLRFPEFQEEWVVKKIDEIAEKVNSGKTPLGGDSVYSETGILFIRSQNVADNRLSYENSTFIPEEINDTMKNSIVKPRDILLNITGASLGRSCVVPDDFTVGNVNQHVCIVRLNKSSDPYFLQPIFSSEKGQNLFTSLQTGSGREGLNFQSIRQISLPFPTLPEQQKIASFLTAVDEKLHALKKKKSLLERYKKGVMQKIFSQELRFKGEDGEEFPDWEEKKLGEIAEKRILKNKHNLVKNVFTNSASQGIVNQRDYFDKDIANQNNLLSYYIVERDDFVYNPRISNLAPVGPIGRNHMDTGVMSPLYSVFRIKYGSLDFFETYFSTDEWHEYMESIANYGARADRMSISTGDFYLMPVPFPSADEQIKIANFLSAIDEKINLCGKEIEKTAEWKKGLLQGMFC
jgi:type I restriction enzyme S subunit